MRILPSLSSLIAEWRRAPADIDLTGHHRGERSRQTACRGRLRLQAELLDKADDDIVRTRAVGGIGDRVFVGCVFQSF